jgi:hypothetical protein
MIGVDWGRDASTLVVGVVEDGVLHVTDERRLTLAPCSVAAQARIKAHLIESYWRHRDRRAGGNARQRRHARRHQQETK